MTNMIENTVQWDFSQMDIFVIFVNHLPTKYSRNPCAKLEVWSTEKLIAKILVLENIPLHVHISSCTVHDTICT